MLPRFLEWVLNRLREPSTWRGIVWLLTACGLTLRPDVWGAIITVGMAVVGLIGVIASENLKEVAVQLPPIELIGKSENATTKTRFGVNPVADNSGGPDFSGWTDADLVKLAAGLRAVQAERGAKFDADGPVGFGDKN